MIDLAEIKGRINPAYADRRGTESHERKMLCDEIERLRAALQYESDVAEAYKAEADALRKDVERLDFIERKSRESYTGISFDWTKYVDDGQVVEVGYRMAWRHTLNGRCKTLRAAIDAAMKGGE